jgi:hypothetical protein
MRDDSNALFGKHLRQRQTHFRLIAMGEELGAAFQKGDLGPQAVKHLPQFQGAIPASPGKEGLRTEAFADHALFIATKSTPYTWV